MMNRRRFILVSAAAAAGATRANAATPMRWQGRAMGADVSLVLHGGDEQDLSTAVALIRDAEARFSLYQPNSELSRINDGGGGALSVQMSELLHLSARVHRLSEGLFDPTIQPVFQALLSGARPPWHLVGWDRVNLSANHIWLAPGQRLTLNGIAQGYATDLVRSHLRARGFVQALVSVGEHAAIGGPFRLALQDPQFGQVGTRTLTGQAIATSSPLAMTLGDKSHILHPNGQSGIRWSTVSVEAQSAALADGLSTALCHAPIRLVDKVARAMGVRVTLVDHQGDVMTRG